MNITRSTSKSEMSKMTVGGLRLERVVIYALSESTLMSTFPLACMLDVELKCNTQFSNDLLNSLHIHD
jgi:hypothetical protein